MPSYSRSRGHRRTHQVSPPTATLTAFKVAIRSGRAAFAWLKDVGVHAKAHAAARLSPVESRRLEDFIEPFTLCLLLDLLRARHDHRVKPGRDVPATDHRCRSSQVLDPRVSA